MTWHLKDRTLESVLEKYSDGNFVKALNFAIERDWIDAANVVTVEFERKILLRGYTNDLSFRTDELEEVAEYNPNAWNNYPEVTPPKRVLMRIEYKDSKGNLVRECAMFVDVVGAPLPSYWMTAQWNAKEDEIVEDAYRIDSNNYLIEDGMKLRFRPWED